jgi:chitin disaccharide deacetylase
MSTHRRTGDPVRRQVGLRTTRKRKTAPRMPFENRLARVNGGRNRRETAPIRARGLELTWEEEGDVPSRCPAVDQGASAFPDHRGSRFLIVNADDLGQDAGIDAGILEAAARGIVTSASLMVRWPDASQAASTAVRRGMSVGLHLDLGEWSCVDGNWFQLYAVVDSDDLAAVEAEVSRQATTFYRLLGRDPSHVDSHQHVHRGGAAHAAAAALADRLRVPLREQSGRVRYVGCFYGQGADGTAYPEGISARRLIALLDGLPAAVSELSCHPGRSVGVETMYRQERQIELETLCDPRVLAAVRARNIELISFSNLPRR